MVIWLNLQIISADEEFSGCQADCEASAKITLVL